MEVLKKNISSKSDIEVFAKSSGVCNDILSKIEVSREKDSDDCEERLKSLRFILGTRQRLRRCKKDL